jgi:SSS family solute:Na+ symporter
MAIIILSLYIFILLFVGYFVKSKIKTTDDYILGGRSIPWFLIATSLAANDIGAGASLGIIQSSAKGEGLSAAWYIWLMIPAYIIGMLIAPYMRKTEVKTVPDFFRIKYGSFAQKLSAFFIIIPNVGIIAINFTASASLLQILTGFDFALSLAISVTITTTYSYLGGLLADVYNDAIQIVIIVIGFALASLFIYTAFPLNKPIVLHDFFNGDFDTKKIITLLILYSAVFIVGLSTTTRIYSAKSAKDVKKGILATLPIYLIYAILPAFIGVVLSENKIANFDTTSILGYLQGAIPQFVLILLFLGIIAASLSTVDTLLIGCSAMLFNDVLSEMNGSFKSEKKKLIILRGIVFLVAICSFLIAIIGINDIIPFLLFLLSLQTCALFVPFVFGHIFKNLHPLQSNVTILFSSFVFSLMFFLKIEFYFINPLFGGILSGTILYFIIYKITKKVNVN